MGSRTELHNIAGQIRELHFGVDLEHAIESCAALLQSAVERGAFADVSCILLRNAIDHGDISRVVQWVETNGFKLPFYPFMLTNSRAIDDAWVSSNMLALASLLEAEANALSRVETLPEKANNALEDNGPGSPEPDRTADTKTDKKKKTSPQIPVNEDILRLAKKIKTELRVVKVKREIALDYTGGDQKKAENLLRGIRRYPHLLD